MPEKEVKLEKQLSPLNVWALAFGCIIGWGAFVMPGNTFLVENYPVEVRLADIVVIIVAVVAVNYVITKLTVRRMVPKIDKPDETRF